MSGIPALPAVYHITHVGNLPSIVADGGVYSDRVMMARGGPYTSIGMSKVKADRLAKELDCHPGLTVGDFVPFNFCPRSVMLYVVYARSSPSMTYRGGQGPVVHLVADFNRVVDWADANGVPWAITDINARTSYARSFASRSGLDELDWPAIGNNDFRDTFVQQSKQAEFLLHRDLPWELVEHIGARSMDVVMQVTSALGGAAYKPTVSVERSWYF